MTTSYLDEAWFDSQASELEALQGALSAHLDVIALAKEKIPDLAAQIQRLAEREHETLESLSSERQSALDLFDQSTQKGIREIESKSGEINQLLSKHLHDSQWTAPKKADRGSSHIWA